MELSGKVALVTGGSSGIGLALARALVASGARVALAARSEARLARAVSELGEEHAQAFAADVNDRTGLSRLVRGVLDRFGRLDVLVNNAGVNHRGALGERSPAELAEILETNLVSPVLLVREALPHLAEGGAIVLVASLAGKVPVPHEAAYSASKAGIRAFGRALRYELAELGRDVRVLTVCPGPVDTAFFGDLAEVPNLVFSQPMSSAEHVAEKTVHAIRADHAELDIPAISGKLATAAYLLPRVFRALRPLLERRGAHNKARYFARRAAKSE